MPLCGNASCGCIMTTKPATTGGLSGTYPTIEVSGSGGFASPFLLKVNPAWVAKIHTALTFPAAWVSAGATFPITQGVDVTNTVSLEKLFRQGPSGKVLTIYLKLTVSGAGTAGTAVTVTLPFPIVAPVGTIIGYAHVNDVSATAHYVCAARVASSTTISFANDQAAATAGWGAGPNLALAAGDIVYANVTYETT